MVNETGDARLAYARDTRWSLGLWIGIGSPQHALRLGRVSGNGNC
jgi:hypothetical protein